MELEMWDGSQMLMADYHELLDLRGCCRNFGAVMSETNSSVPVRIYIVKDISFVN